MGRAGNHREAVEGDQIALHRETRLAPVVQSIAGFVSTFGTNLVPFQ